MATETSARADPLHWDGLQERDYQTFSTALSASARGRAFLAEYARRNRNADTELLLAAIDKLQTLIAAKKEPAKAESIRFVLHALLEEITAARSELDAGIQTMKASKLADLVVLVEQRIGSIIASLPAETKTEIEPTPAGESDVQPEKADRTFLAVIPQPDQPELPIPSPTTTLQPAIALVRTEATMAEVTFIDPVNLRGRDQDRFVIEIPRLEPMIAAGVESTSITTSTSHAADPLASIMALGEEERLALFS